MDEKIEEIVRIYGAKLTHEELSSTILYLVDLVALLHESNSRSDVIKRGISLKKQKKLEKKLRQEAAKKATKSN